MSHLIVGNVTPTTACIWVRGHERSGQAQLKYRAKGSADWLVGQADLDSHRGYTAVITLDLLNESTSYECELSYPTERRRPLTGASR